MIGRTGRTGDWRQLLVDSLAMVASQSRCQSLTEHNSGLARARYLGDPGPRDSLPRCRVSLLPLLHRGAEPPTVRMLQEHGTLF